MSLKAISLNTGVYTTILQPLGERYATMGIWFTNTHQHSGEYLNVYAVPRGQEPSGSNMLLKEVFVPASDTWHFADKMILSDQDKLVVYAHGFLHSGHAVNAISTYTNLDGLG
jgi:hypothetical protein